MRPTTRHGWLRRAVPAVAAAACALAAATPAAARSGRLPLRPLDPKVVTRIHLFPPHAPDRVLVKPLRTHASQRARSGASSTVFRTGDGVGIQVQVSDAYVPNATVERGYVSFLGG